jgi:hypothetical protein
MLWTSEINTRKRLIALGEFVLEFAEAESRLLETLRVVGNVSDEFARAALSGVRADAAMQYIDRLFEVMPPDEKVRALYREIFPRFRDINRARNLILHYGISEDETGHVATNKSRALTAKKTDSMRVSTEILHAMTSDLVKIDAILKANLLTLQKRQIRPGDLLNYVRQPWLYNPQRQGRLDKAADQKRPGSSTKRARPPKSSPK